MAIFTWFTDNWAAILAVVTAVVVAADKIVALTPTQADDVLEAKVKAALVNFGLIKPF